MPTEYLLTGHAQQRLKERLKVKNIRRAHREMELAYNKGTPIKRMQTHSTVYVLFNNAVYVYNEIIGSLCKMVLLITVYKDVNKIYRHM